MLGKAILIAVLCASGQQPLTIVKEQATVPEPIRMPIGLTTGVEGTLYVADRQTHRILGINPRRGMFLVAGTGKEGYQGDNGLAVEATFSAPTELAVDPAGNLYVSDSGNHVIRRIDLSTGLVSTVVGTGKAGYSGDNGTPGAALLDEPAGLAFDDRGILFIADPGNQRIRQVDFRADRITTIAGNGNADLPRDGGLAAQESLLGPRSLVANGRFLWVALDSGNRVYRMRIGGEIRLIVGSGTQRDGKALPAPQPGVSLPGVAAPSVAMAKDLELSHPQGIAIGPDRRVYISDTGNNRVLRLDAVNGEVEVALQEVTSPRGLAPAGPIGPMAVVDGGAARITKIGEPLLAGNHVARATMFRDRANLDLTSRSDLRDYDTFKSPPVLPLGIVWPLGSWTGWYDQPTFPQHIVYPSYRTWAQSRLSTPWQLPPGYPTISSGQPISYQPFYRFESRSSIGSYAHPGR